MMKGGAEKPLARGIGYNNNLASGPIRERPLIQPCFDRNGHFMVRKERSKRAVWVRKSATDIAPGTGAAGDQLREFGAHP